MELSLQLSLYPFINWPALNESCLLSGNGPAPVEKTSGSRDRFLETKKCLEILAQPTNKP